MSGNNTVYLVTGGNRGIGLGLVQVLLPRPFTTVIATVRSQAKASELEQTIEFLPKGEQSILYTVEEVDYSSDNSLDHIKKLFDDALGDKIKHVDVLICNAGYFTTMSSVLETTADALRSHFEVNTIGPLLTVQALWPRMKNSVPNKPPKFILISSSVGSIGMMERMPGGAYGPSKAAANWVTKALHQQHGDDGLISVALHPGFVQTRMGNAASDQWDFPGGPPDTVEVNAKSILNIIDVSARDKYSGQFVTQNGIVLDW